MNVPPKGINPPLRLMPVIVAPIACSRTPKCRMRLW
jgi:hypothetical protein